MNALTSIQDNKVGIMVLAEDLESALPLEHTEYNIHITGSMAAAAVVQRFGNPLSEPAELVYLFPLPHDAAINGFEFRVGKRKISGRIEEQERARDIFEEARASGRRAGLLKEHRPNLFSIHLANVLPGETIEARLQYGQRIKLEDGRFEVVIPMGITPRYQDPTLPAEAEINPPVSAPGEITGPVAVTISVDAGCAVSEPESTTHPLEIIRQDPSHFQVRLAGEQSADHDFVLGYELTSSKVQSSAWTSKEDDGDIFMAALIPPALDSEAIPPLRELVFVIDRSGSMSGEPIAQARNALRACLRSLYDTDTFRILTFDSVLEWFQSEASAATEKQIQLADQFLDQVEGRGGTDILSALQAALGLQADPLRQRYIVFLTDGAVSAEARAMAEVKKHLQNARIFTFGIGPSVNRALLDKMAAMGRGRAEFLGVDEDIEGAILRFQDRLAFPVLTDLKLIPRDVKIWDMTPVQLPDLYGGPALEISGRFLREGSQPAIVIQGRANGQPVLLEARLPEAAFSVPVVRTLWAKSRADTLLDKLTDEDASEEKIRSQVIKLSLEYGFVTAYTSFIAVDEDIAAHSKPRKIRVSQPLPQGLQREGFGLTNVLYSMAPPAIQQGMPRAKASVLSPKRLFQGSTNAHPNNAMTQSPGPLFSDRIIPVISDSKDPILRNYARTQEADGSWDHDLEMTAAVLLNFVRRGKTTRKGEFRRIVQKSFEWLSSQAVPAGFAAFARAAALHELAEATQVPKQVKAAEQAAAALPAAQSVEEKLVADLLNGSAVRPIPDSPPNDLHGARLAGLSGVKPESDQADAAARSNPLIAAWLACTDIEP